MYLFSSGAHKGSIPWAAFAPIAVLGIGFVVYCVADIVRHSNARNLPRWAWVVICFVSVPLGGIAYLIFGRSEDR